MELSLNLEVKEIKAVYEESRLVGTALVDENMECIKCTTCKKGILYIDYSDSNMKCTKCLNPQK